MNLRSLLRRIPILERRWIVDPEERDDHDDSVRRRLQDGVPVADDEEPEPATEASAEEARAEDEAKAEDEASA